MVVVVLVVRTDDLLHVFLHVSQGKRRKGGRTPESQTPGVPVPWASTSKRTEAKKYCISCSKIPSSEPPQLVEELI